MAAASAKSRTTAEEDGDPNQASGAESGDSTYQNCDSAVETSLDDTSDYDASGESGDAQRKKKSQKIVTMEVCREFIQKRCRRTEAVCRYAHPPPHVEVTDGHVTCCYDFSKGRCHRSNPPCRYYHAPTKVSSKEASRLHQSPVMNRGMAADILPPYLVQAIASYTANLQQQMLQQHLQLYQQQLAAGLLPNAGGLPFVPQSGASYSANSVPRDRLENIFAFNQQAWPCLLMAGHLRGPATSHVPPFGVSYNSGNTVPRDRLEVCREYKRSKCDRKECRYAHPPDWMTADVSNSVRVCVDYVHGRCERESCRYYHPPAHLSQTVLNQLKNNNVSRRSNGPRS